jgi:Xaa-Pro aminopeptidase
LIVAGLERVLAAMARDDIDVLLLGREGNVRYVTGACRLYLAGERAFAPGCVVVRATGTVHLLSASDAGIPDLIPRTNLYPITWDPRALLARIADMAGVYRARRVGVDGLTPGFDVLIERALPNAILADGEALLRDVRRVKTGDEIDAIRASIDVAQSVMTTARTAASAGESDSTIVATAMAEMARRGSTIATFEPLVDHAGDLTVVDVGVLYDGWEAGLRRTQPGAAPNAGHHAAIDRCRVGTRVETIAPNRSVHGVGNGYEVLESGTELAPNMVVSVATGYARDIVLVTQSAPEVLTTAPYD